MPHFNTAQVDDIIEAALTSDEICTVGIGDGGNEIGMGKVLQKVEEFISNGGRIGCSVSTDVLLSCGKKVAMQ